MKKGDLFRDGIGTILQFEKYDEDGSPLFIAVDNKDGYVLNPEGYVSFGQYFDATSFKKVDTPIIIPDYRAFHVKYISANDSKPARVRVTDMQSGETAVVLHEDRFFVSDASMYLNKRGIRVVGRSFIDGGYILLADICSTPIV